MKELAKEYKASAEVLHRRIKELMGVKDLLLARTKDPEKDLQIIELSNRIKPLQIMLHDVNDIGREIEHYYDKEWWKSEKYMLNARKSRKFIYAGSSRHPDKDECGETKADADVVKYSVGIIIDRKAKTGCEDVLRRG